MSALVVSRRAKRWEVVGSGVVQWTRGGGGGSESVDLRGRGSRESPVPRGSSTNEGFGVASAGFGKNEGAGVTRGTTLAEETSWVKDRGWALVRDERDLAGRLAAATGEEAG